MAAKPDGRANIKADTATLVRTSSIILIPDASWQPHLTRFWMQFHLVRPQYALFGERNATRYLMELKIVSPPNLRKERIFYWELQRNARLRSRRHAFDPSRRQLQHLLSHWKHRPSAIK